MKKLSRDEMKKIFGGYAPVEGGASCGCATDADCGNQDHKCSSSKVITCSDNTTGKACVRA